MSYQHMDHGAWVQRQIPCAKGRRGKRRKDLTKGWDAAPDQLSEFHLKVFDILGMTYGGIYNAPIAWDAVQWTGWGRGIGIPVKKWGGLCTWDFAHLTRLVFLCHEARIRGDVAPHGFGCFLLSFFPRSHEGGMQDRHPNLDEAVADFRAYLPAGHRIIYTAPPEPAE